MKKIRIGRKLYRVKDVNVSNEFEDYNPGGMSFRKYPFLGLIGQMCNQSKTIWVKRTGLTKKEQKQVLFHEITHALCYQMYDSDKRYHNFKPMHILNHDEKFVDDFSKILMKTFEIKSLIPKNNEKTKNNKRRQA